MDDIFEISQIIFSSRSDVNIYFKEKIVRIPGELMVSFFLADPYSMFWVNKEDTNILPWELPSEKKAKILTEEERLSVMGVVDKYYKHKKEPIIFYTKEFEDYAFELASKIRNKELSKFRAKHLLRKNYSSYPSTFYKDVIEAALNGNGWYR